jgi:transposase InsO family protein
VYSWDITYLAGPLRGAFFYLYLFVDIFSRKIVGWRVEDEESMELSSELLVRICSEQDIESDQLTIHADNGGPMKGATMLATMQKLGVASSFSRPSVSNDNPYSESIFRTLKYRPGFPSKPFKSIEAARKWVVEFVRWYNHHHLHSGIKYVTPAARHAGEDRVLLTARESVYRTAKSRHPERWSGAARDWSYIGEVHLNPEAGHAIKSAALTVAS